MEAFFLTCCETDQQEILHTNLFLYTSRSASLTRDSFSGLIAAGGLGLFCCGYALLHQHRAARPICESEAEEHPDEAQLRVCDAWLLALLAGLLVRSGS